MKRYLSVLGDILEIRLKFHKALHCGTLSFLWLCFSNFGDFVGVNFDLSQIYFRGLMIKLLRKGLIDL